jgi:hypothetical protein
VLWSNVEHAEVDWDIRFPHSFKSSIPSVGQVDGDSPRSRRSSSFILNLSLSQTSGCKLVSRLNLNFNFFFWTTVQKLFAASGW